MSEQVEQNEGSEEHIEAPVNEVEEKARAQGWVPKDEWQGTGKWRDAETFLDRGELFEKIDSQRRKLRELEDNQKAFATHLETTKKAAYNDALKALRQEKKDALIEGDPDKVIEVDERIAELREEQAKAAVEQKPQTNAEAAAAFEAWHSRNTWYAPENRAMKVFADSVGMQLGDEVRAGRMTPAEVLKEIETQVRKEFPEKFTNPNRAKPGAVEAGSNRGVSSKEQYALSDDERNVMNRLVKSGIITKEKYIADLKAAKGER